MRIQKVEAMVGITKKNIRFYEQEGLISPQRNRENGYREYDENDILRLKKIRLFRRLGVPIEDLRKLFSGTLTVSDTMTRHTVVLNREMHNLEQACILCQEMAQDELTFSELDPDVYLERMDLLEAKGASFMNHKQTDIKKQMLSPALAALVMILFMAALAAIMVWANSVDPIPLPVLLFLLLIPLAICIGVLLALISRWREIQTGEAEEADKY